MSSNLQNNEMLVWNVHNQYPKKIKIFMNDKSVKFKFKERFYEYGVYTTKLKYYSN